MRILLAVCMLFMSGICFASLTNEEEIYLKAQYAKTEAEKTYRAIILERDNLLLAEDVKCNQAKNVIMAQYDQQIKDAENLIK